MKKTETKKSRATVPLSSNGYVIFEKRVSFTVTEQLGIKPGN
jgi:hypothetical protein